jgi:hypothetical protein
MHFRSERKAAVVLRKLRPLGIQPDGGFTHLPSDAECEQIKAAYRTLEGRLPRGTAVRSKEYVGEIERRETWRQEIGMDDHGVTQGMRDYLERQKESA